MASNNILDGFISLAQAAAQFLHIGTGDFGAGAVVRQGDGTQSGLVVYSDGIGSRNAGGFRTKLVSLATATRLLKFPDGDLDLTPLLMGAQKVSVPATVSNSTVTPTALSMVDAQGNPITLVANGIYEVIGYFVCTAAATTTGCRLRLDGPTGSSLVSLIWQQPTASSYSADFHAQGLGVGFDYAPTTAPVAATNYPQIVRGVIKMGGTVSADPLAVSVYSEIAASSVSVVAGSYLRVTRIA